MLKHLLAWLAIPRRSWRVRLFAGLMTLVSGVLTFGLIDIGIEGWPGFGYFLNFGGLSAILAIIACVVTIHGYIGVGAKWL